MATRFNTQVGNGEYRLQFETDNKEYYLLMQSTARRCVDCVHMTNANRIRSMTDEELALWICGVYDSEEENGKFINGIIIPGYAPHDIEEWLQQPAEDIGAEPNPCPFCKFAEVFYGEYDTFSDTTFGGYKIRCKCGYAYRKSVWCDSANEAIEAWNRRVSDDKAD